MGSYAAMHQANETKSMSWAGPSYVVVVIILPTYTFSKFTKHIFVDLVRSCMDNGYGHKKSKAEIFSYLPN